MKSVILTPVGSQTHHNFTHSIQATERAFPGQVDWVDTAGVSDVAAGRNRLLDEFLRMTMAGIAVWIDSDESWSPEDFAAVVTPIIHGDAEVVAAPYAMKKQGAPWYNFSLHPEDCDVDKGYIGDESRCGDESSRARSEVPASDNGQNDRGAVRAVDRGLSPVWRGLRCVPHNGVSRA